MKLFVYFLMNRLLLHFILLSGLIYIIVIEVYVFNLFRDIGIQVFTFKHI